MRNEKYFIHPVLGKIIGYSNMKEFDKHIKEYNNKNNTHIKKMKEIDNLYKNKDITYNGIKIK